MTDIEALTGEHQDWCQAEGHATCCAGEYDCGRDDRREAIAAALAAERDKARAPFRALVAFYDRHEYGSLNVDDLRELLAEP